MFKKEKGNIQVFWLCDNKWRSCCPKERKTLLYCLQKKITTFKELKSNIGDFRKHFDNEVFFDFTNIAEESEAEKKIMLFCSGWAKTLMSQTEAIYIDGTYKKASKLFRMLYAVMAEVTNRTADKAVPVA